MAHGHVPVESIAAQALGARSGGHPSLLNVVFSVISDSLPDIRLGDCTAERLPVPPRWAKFPLLVSVETSHAGAALVAEFDRGKLDAEFADSLLRALRQFLAHVVTDPQADTDEVDLLTGQDRAAALDRARGPGRKTC